MTTVAGRNRPDLDAALETVKERYSAARPKSLEVFEAASQVMPGGNTRTVLFHEPFPFRAVKGEGARLHDLDGHAYVNLLGEYTAGLFGHDHPIIKRALRQALDAGVNLGAHNNYEPRFAALVCARFPGIELVRFTNSGTEANLMALTTARIATGREKVLVFEGGYHGGTFYFAPGVATNAPFDWIVAPFNDVEAASAAIREAGESLAAVLVEPMMGSGGCIAAAPGFLETLRRETERVGAVLIFDEVMTSRLAPGGAQELLDIRPDLTTLGKWIGGGMSFGAFGGRRDLMARYDPRRSDALPHAGTFNNNVLTMAAGIAALEQVYGPEEARELNARGEALRAAINDFARREGLAFHASGRGSLMTLHPDPGPITHYQQAAGLDDRLRALLFFDLLDAGFYIARRGFIALSLALTADDLAAFRAALEQILLRRADFFTL